MKKLQMAAGLALAFAVTSIGGAAAADACEGRQSHSVYFATHAIPHPFWSTIEAGAEQGAKDSCLDFKWTQDVEFSVATTIERMETAITEQPDVLVITATDPTAMGPTVQRAIDAGIAVIAINVNDPAPRTERLPYLIYIGGNEYEGGAEAANQVLAAGQPSRAVCLNSFPGHVGLEARCAGWADVMQQAGVVVEQVDVSGGAVQAEAALSAYLIANPDADAFFTVSPGPENYGVALSTLKAEGLIGDVALTTFDMNDEILAAIRSGETLAAIDQQPYLQGYLASVLARQYLDAGLMPGRDILTGPGVVNAANIDKVLAGADLGRR